MRIAIAAGLVLSLVVVPLNPARAADWQVAPLPVKADPSSEVQTLFDTGMDRFHGADYDQALILWKRAFVLLSHDLAVQDLRATLVVDIVVAHGRAHEFGRNPEHLVEAMRVIDLRKAEIDRFQAYDEIRVAEMRDLDTRRAELARRREVALSEGEWPRKLADGTAFHLETPPAPTLTRKQLDKALEADVAIDRKLGPEFRSAKSMRDAGFIFLMMGVVLVPVGGMLTGAAFDPKDGVAPILGPLVAAPFIMAVPLILGGTLYGIGKKRTKQIKAQYEARPNPLARMPVPMPISLSQGGGIGFVGRF